VTEVLSEIERMPEGEELERMLAHAHAGVLDRIAHEKRSHRRRRTTFWSGIGVLVIAGAAVAASPPLRTVLIPDNGGARAYLVVQCFAKDGTRTGSNSYEDDNATTDAARADPAAVCVALEQQTSVLNQQNAIAAQQRALGRQCVTFADSRGGTWTITGLQSPDKTYSTLGGPAPWHLPGDIGPIPVQPRPSLGPSTVPSGGCTRITTVTWHLAVPPLTACTTDGVTVSVYERATDQTPKALCATKGMTVAGR